MRASAGESRNLTRDEGPVAALSSASKTTAVSDSASAGTQVVARLRSRGAARVRLDRQPNLKPAERRVSIGNLDRDRQPPLDQAPELAGQLRKRRRAPNTMSDRPPEKNGF